MLRRPWRVICFAFAASALALSSGARILIEDFGDSSCVQRWKFGEGSEFPGANGSFQVVSVNGNANGQLQFDLNGGGEYVSAQRDISQALCADDSVIILRVKQQPGALLFVRVLDQSGQTLQYNAPRPLEATGAGQWSWTKVALDRAAEHWGGANTGRPAGGITRITVGIKPISYPDWNGKRVMSAKTGSVSFDDIFLVNNSERIVITGKEIVIEPTEGNPTLDSLGVAIHFADNLIALQAAINVGAKVLRTDLFWARVESERGQYNFAPWDKLVGSATSRGLKVVLVLGYGNRLYTGGSDKPPTSLEAITAFGDFAEAAAKHFAGKGVSYEIWNEPNLQKFWSPADPISYAALLKVAASRISLADPTALVYSGGLAQTDFPYLSALLETGALDVVHSVGVHPYDWTAPELQIDGLVFLQYLLNSRHTALKSLSITECGISSAWFGPGNDPRSRKKQANLLLRQVLVHLGAGRPLNIVYDLLDDGTNPADPEQNFGLYQMDLLPKPAAEVLSLFRQLAADKTIEGFLDVDPRVHVFAMKGPNGRTFIIWTELGRPVSVEVPATAQVGDIYGQPVTIGPDRQIAVSEKPLVVWLNTSQ